MEVYTLVDTIKSMTGVNMKLLDMIIKILKNFVLTKK